MLDLVAAGLGNKEIGRQLGISEQAVKEHVSALLRTLAAPNRAALADAAATNRFAGTFEIDPDWLRFLFLAAPMHVAVVAGPEHRFVAANELYRESAGRELIGKTHRELFPDRAESRALLDQVLASGQPTLRTALPRRFVREAGGGPEDGFITFVMQPLPGAEGRTAGVAIFSIDVTDAVRARRRAEELERQEVALLDLLTTGVVVVDKRGRLLRANDAARRLISIPEGSPQLTPENVSAYALRDAADGRPIPFDEIPTVRAMRGEVCRDPIVYRVHDPERNADRLLRVSAMPLLRDDGAIGGAVTTLTET